MIRWRCACGEELEAPESMVSQAVTCPRCGTPQGVRPEQPAWTPAVAPARPLSAPSTAVMTEAEWQRLYFTMRNAVAAGIWRWVVQYIAIGLAIGFVVVLFGIIIAGLGSR